MVVYMGTCYSLDDGIVECIDASNNIYYRNIAVPRPIIATRGKKDWYVTKVLSAKDVGLSVGVGTPFIVRDPDTYQPYILFTGWNDPSGIARMIFVGEIDENLRVRNVKKVADPSLFNVSGLNTVHAFWDDYNQQWVLFTTFYGAPSNNTAGVIYTDKNFNVVGTQTLTFNNAGGSGVNLSDAGVSPVPLFNKMLLMSAGFDLGRSLFYINDFTKRPLPNPTIVNGTSSNAQFQIVPSYYASGADVNQLFVSEYGVRMLSELIHYRSLWFINVFYGAEKDYLVDSTFVPFFFVAPLVPPFPIHFTDIVGNIGHPHYTNYLGEPMLFFARFPTWNTSGPRNYAHDIWVMNIDPKYVFDPTGKALVATGPGNPVPNLPIPTFGSKTLIIEIYGASTSGTLTLTESSSPYHIWTQTNIRYTTSYNISAGSNKIVVTDPTPWISIGISGATISEWAILMLPE